MTTTITHLQKIKDAINVEYGEYGYGLAEVYTHANETPTIGWDGPSNWPLLVLGDETPFAEELQGIVSGTQAGGDTGFVLALALPKSIAGAIAAAKAAGIHFEAEDGARIGAYV